MTIRQRGIDDVFAYPCTKADVLEAFAESPLASVSFGLTPDHSFSRRETPGEISGRIIAQATVSIDPFSDAVCLKSSLYLYRVRKDEWSAVLHWHLRELLKLNLRPWIEAMHARPETAWEGRESRLIELRDGVLRVHARRAK